MALDTSKTYRPDELASYVGGVNETWDKKQFNVGGQQYEIQDIGGGMRKVNPLGGGSNGSYGTGSDANSYIQNAIKQMQDANKPIISSYQASIPETQKRYADERTRLEGEKVTVQDRYKSLIDQIKGNQAAAETRQTLTTNNELGKRGITSSSGLAQQEMTNALNPITQQYTGMLKDTGLSQEADLKDISSKITDTTNNETDALRAIQNAIAQLNSGATTQGISLGTDLFKTDQTLAAQKEAAAATARQQQIENALKTAQLGLEEKKTNYEVNKPYYEPKDAGISSLLSLLNPGSSNNGSYISEIGKSVVGFDSVGRAIYSDGTRGYTYGKNSSYWNG